MTDHVQQLLQDALSLSASERAAIAEQLLFSLEPPDARAEALWAIEVDARIAAYDDGVMETVSEEEFFAETESL